MKAQVEKKSGKTRAAGVTTSGEGGSRADHHGGGSGDLGADARGLAAHAERTSRRRSRRAAGRCG